MQPQNPTQHMPSQPAVTAMECPRCKRPVIVELRPGQIFNMKTVSQFITEHEGEVLCPCGAVIVPVLAGVQAQFKLVEVPPEQRRKLVHGIKNLKI